MRKLLTLILLTFALTGAGPMATAWEREAFKALKGIKDMATEQAKQEKAEKEKAAREQAAKEQAERDEQEKAAREEAAKQQAEREAQRKAKAEEWARERAERQQICNPYKHLADDFSIVEYAQGKGVLTPENVKKIREQFKACNMDIQTTAGDPSCPHFLYAMRVQENITFSDRRAALEAEGMYEQMKKAKEYGILTPSQEMEIDGLKNDLWEKRKAKNASQRKFEIMYRQADEAGCLDKQS